MSFGESYDYCSHCGAKYFIICSCKKAKEEFYNEELKQELINDIRQSTNQFDVKIYINGEAWA